MSPEPVVEGFISTGARPPGGWYVRLPLIGLTEAQTRRIREQALEALDRYGESERAIIRNTFEAIVEATEQRLGLRPAVRATGLVPNVFLIDVVPDETDPWSQMRDDRGTVVAFVLRYAEDTDEAIATIWHALAEDFDVIRFSGGDGVIQFRT